MNLIYTIFLKDFFLYLYIGMVSTFIIFLYIKQQLHVLKITHIKIYVERKS